MSRRRVRASTEVVAHGVHRRASELLGHLPDDEVDRDEPLDVGLDDAGELVAIRAHDPPREYALRGRPGRSVALRYVRNGDAVIVTTFRAGQLLGEERA